MLAAEALKDRILMGPEFPAFEPGDFQRSSGWSDRSIRYDFAVEQAIQMDGSMLARKKPLTSRDFQAERFGLGGKGRFIKKLKAATRDGIDRIDQIVHQIRCGVEILVPARRKAEDKHEQVRNTCLVRIFYHTTNRLN